VGARFPAPVQKGPGAHPPTVHGYRVFPGGKANGGGVDHPPHLGPRLKKGQAYTTTPPLGLQGLFGVKFTLTLLYEQGFH